MGLGFLLSAGAALLALATWEIVVRLVKRYRRKHDADSFFTATIMAPQHVDRQGYETMKLRNGPHAVWLRVVPKRMVTIEYFNIRFVTRFVGMDPVDADESSVFVTEVSHQETVRSPELDQEPDTKGGLHVYPEGGFTRGPGYPLWLQVMAYAQKPWEGYISFKSRSDRGETCFARAYVCFLP